MTMFTKWISTVTSLALLSVLVVGCAANASDDDAETAESTDALESVKLYKDFSPGCYKHGGLKDWASKYCRDRGWAGAKNRDGIDRCSATGSAAGIFEGSYRGVRFNCYK